MSDLLAEARNPDETRRFYPLGEHPATSRWREELAHLEELEARGADAGEAIAYAKEQLARFEWGEDRAKREYLLVHKGTVMGGCGMSPATLTWVDSTIEGETDFRLYGDGQFGLSGWRGTFRAKRPFAEDPFPDEVTLRLADGSEGRVLLTTLNFERKEDDLIFVYHIVSSGRFPKVGEE